MIPLFLPSLVHTSQHNTVRLAARPQDSNYINQRSFLDKSSSQTKIRKVLQQVKNRQCEAEQMQQRKKQASVWALMENAKKLQQARKKQKCIHLQKEISSEEENNILEPNNDVYVGTIQNERRALAVRQVCTQEKPAHRYKVRMVAYQNSLFVFGGLGCQRDLTWGKLSLPTLTWTFPTHQQSRIDGIQPMPVYGHSMVNHRSHAYIYGGVSTDVSNDLLIFNMRNCHLSMGPQAPFRRKDHVAHLFSRYMIVHGGFDGRQVTNDLFVYDIDEERWQVLDCSKMPYRANHGITSMTSASTAAKAKRKQVLGAQASDWMYIFGGIDQDQLPSNQLFRFRIVQGLEVEIEQIYTASSPKARHSMSFHCIDNNYLLVYGGRQIEEQNDSDQQCGVFGDIHLFNVQHRQWIRPELTGPIEHRHSMASTVLNGRLFVFGGSLKDHYANGNIVMIKHADITGISKQMWQIEDKVEKVVDSQSQRDNMVMDLQKRLARVLVLDKNDLNLDILRQINGENGSYQERPSRMSHNVGNKYILSNISTGIEERQSTNLTNKPQIRLSYSQSLSHQSSLTSRPHIRMDNRNHGNILPPIHLRTQKNKTIAGRVSINKNNSPNAQNSKILLKSINSNNYSHNK